MPKIKKNYPVYASDAFQREVTIRKAVCGIKRDRDIADMLGISPSFYNHLKRNPFRMNMTQLRMLVQVLKPDPVVVLKTLGYSEKEITKKFQEG